MLEAVICTDGDLGGEAFGTGVDGSADDGGEAGVDEDLPADDDKDPVALGIAGGVLYAVEFASLHEFPFVCSVGRLKS
jgi:hypothetical protein